MYIKYKVSVQSAAASGEMDKHVLELKEQVRSLISNVDEVESRIEKKLKNTFDRLLQRL